MVSSLSFNRKRLFLLSGALGLGLSLSVISASPSYAQSQKELNPTQGWSVSKVESDTPYCTLSRPYNNESVLSFGRTADDEYSLAIDFQKPALDPARAYPITVQPGPGQLRAYQMSPISPQAFVVSLGRDDNFMQTLQETQNLKVKIEEDSYTFEVADFKGALSDLRACQTSQGMVSNDLGSEDGEQKIIAEASRSSAETDILNADPKKIGNEFGAQKTAAAAAIAAPEVEIETSVDVIAPKKVEETKESREAVKISKAEPVQEELVLEIAVAEKAKPVPKSEDILAIDGIDKRKAMPKPEEVSEAKKIAEPKVAKVEEPTAAPTITPPPSVTPTPRISSADYKKIAKAEMLEKEVAALRQRNERLLADVAKASTAREFEKTQEIQQARTQIADLQSRLDAVNVDNKRILNDLEKVRLVNENQVMQSVAGDWDLEKATQRFNEAEREIQRLAGQIEIERTSCQAKMVETEAMLFDPALSDPAQRQKIASMENEIKALREQQSTRVKQETEKVTAIVQEKEKAIEKLEQDVLALRQDSEKKALALASSQSDIERLSAELVTAKATPKIDSAVQIEKDALEKQLGVESAEKAKLSAELVAVKSTLDAQRSSADQVAAIRTEMQRAQSEKAQLQTTLVELQSELQTARMTLDQKNSADAVESTQLVTARNEVERLRNQVSLKDQEILAIRNQSSQTQQDLLRVQSEMTSLRSGQSAETNKIASLTSELAAMRNQLTRAKEANTQQINVLKRDNQRMQTQMNTAKTEQQKATEEIAKARADKDRAEQQANAAKAAAQRAQANVSAARKAIESSRKIASIAPSTGRNIVPSAPSLSGAKPSPMIDKRPAQNDSVLGATELGRMLSAAGIQAGAIQNTGKNSFRWRAGNLNGKASVQTLSSSVENAIQAYIAKDKAQCSGDFASMASSASTRRTSYEIACISPVASRSSSVLFYEKAGSLVAIAHEIDATDMDLAMDARDRLLGQVSNVRAAAY